MAAGGGSAGGSPPRHHRAGHRGGGSSKPRPRLLHVLLLSVGALYALMLRLSLRNGVLSACTMVGIGCADSDREDGRHDDGTLGVALLRQQGQQQRQSPRKRAGERLLFMLSSFDRGERLSGSWEKGKDKLPVILKVVDLARDLCEQGYDVAVAFISAWPASQPESAAQIEGRLQCDRLGGKAPPVTYWDHFNASIGGMLAYQHRFLLKKEINNYDFFIQIEDDTGLTAEQVERYRHHTDFLRGLKDERISTRFLPGFIRFELDPNTGERCLWEGTMGQLDIERLGGVWYAKTTSFINQAGWLGSQQQVLEWHSTCREPFLHGWGPGWVEFFSGGIQLFQECARKKLVPLEEFDAFLVPHLAANKLYHRGAGVTPVAQVKQRLQRLRAACEAAGVHDSQLLPPEQQLTTEERAQVDAAKRAVHPDKRDADGDEEQEEEGQRESAVSPFSLT